MRFVGLLVISVVAIALLTACGGGGTTFSGGGPPGSVCPQVLFAMDLVYPAPGSSGIPASVGFVVVSGPIGKVMLQPDAGAALVSTSQVAVPSPVPSPNVAPVSGLELAFAVPALAAATSYAVIAQDTASDPNCPEGMPRQLGSFATQ